VHTEDPISAATVGEKSSTQKIQAFIGHTNLPLTSYNGPTISHQDLICDPFERSSTTNLPYLQEKEERKTPPSSNYPQK